MLKAQLLEILEKIWPMLIIFIVIISSIRIVYMRLHRQKFVFYKEFFRLLFMLYILILFYAVTYQDPESTTISSYNLIPFKEMFRYEFFSDKFNKNIIGNLLLFVPFGLFLSYYFRTKKMGLIVVLTLISSVTIEFAQRLIIGRVFDVDDIILNVIGGCIGYFIYSFLQTITDYIPKIFKKDWFLNLLTLILVLAIILYICNFDINSVGVLS